MLLVVPSQFVLGSKCLIQKTRNAISYIYKMTCMTDFDSIFEKQSYHR